MDLPYITSTCCSRAAENRFATRTIKVRNCDGNAIQSAVRERPGQSPVLASSYLSFLHFRYFIFIVVFVKNPSDSFRAFSGE